MIVAFIVGFLVGAIFGILTLPIPAPPTLAGVLAIVGIYLGYTLIGML